MTSPADRRLGSTIGAQHAQAGFLVRLARRLVLKQLDSIRFGRIRLQDKGDSFAFGDQPPGKARRGDSLAQAHGRPSTAEGGARLATGLARTPAAAMGETPALGSEPALTASVTVHDPSFYLDTLLGGSVGAGEAYMDGKWSCNDLTALIRILILNRSVSDGLDRGLARLRTPARKLIHFLRRNTRNGSRRNIAAHYDLGNPFFALFLDETMTYSCGIFERPGATLAEASTAKIDRICKKLQLGPTDHVLEIGTGWGSFALHAAGRYGCRVTTTTLSKEQLAFARERVRAAGLEDRIELLLEDYRDLRGSYDKLVSIEMIEAVGHAYFNTYFETCSRLLKPEGTMLLQAITIADQRYEESRRSVDFMGRYIFPGGALPSISVICNSVARATDLALFHMEDLTAHYATTLRKWRENFFENIDRIRELGYPDTFLRMWEFYLCYCEGAFAERATVDTQMLFVKPLSRRPPILPALVP